MTNQSGYDDDLIKLGFEGEQAITAELFLKYGKTYEPKQLIIKEGDRGHDVFLIIAGKVVVAERIQKGSYRVLSSLGPGEIFGEMALIDGTPRSATLIAATQTKVLALNKSGFEMIFKSHPRWTFKMLTALANRISHAFKQLSELHTRQ